MPALPRRRAAPRSDNKAQVEQDVQGLADGELVGVRLPRSLAGEPIQPGHAHLHLDDGALLTASVPRGD